MSNLRRVSAESQLERGRQGRSIAVSGIRDAILRGDMVPAQRLVEAELVEQLGVTRGSVRTAIDDLVAEGLVERIHNRGARVRVVPLEQAVQILECRRALEALIASKAAARATRADVKRLHAKAEELGRAVEDGELLRYSELNGELHTMLAEMSGQTTAAGLIKQLNGQIVRHQFQLSLRPGRPQVSLAQHRAIVDAVAAGDRDAAERAMYEHLSSVIDALQQRG